MRTLHYLALVATLFSVSTSSIIGKETQTKKLPSPQILSARLKQSLAKVKSTVVAIHNEGLASGVIISPQGHILTAAHIMRGIKNDQNFKITLADGKQVMARLLGLNRETDMAVLQITTPHKGKWQCCELAHTSNLTGEFCFTLAHPDGYKKGRPAQVRLGRITTHSTTRGKPYYLTADCNIQPGDSGGPLFSIQGLLIAINSSAGDQLGYNSFSAIDQFHLDKQRLGKGERWGDLKKAPDANRNIEFGIESLTAIQKEFMRRLSIKYPPTVDYVESLAGKTGKVNLTQEAIVTHMLRDAVAIYKKQPLSFGIQDPALNKQLPPMPKNEVKGLPVFKAIDTVTSMRQRLGYGIIVDERHLLIKASILPRDKKIKIFINKKPVTFRYLATDKVWGLAVLRSTKAKLPVVQWRRVSAQPQAGDFLIARDHKSRKIWGLSSDQAREIPQDQSPGPMQDSSLINKLNRSIPLAISHSIPLYAKDSGTAVFNEKGEFVGIHIARITRSQGVIIPVAILQKLSKQLILKSSKR